MTERLEPTGYATLGWSINPQVEWSKDGKPGYVLPYEWELAAYPEYYPHGKGSWPVDPKTGEKLPVRGPDESELSMPIWSFVAALLLILATVGALTAANYAMWRRLDSQSGVNHEPSRTGSR